MKPYKILGLIAASLILPSMAIASSNSVLANEVRVKTANLEAVTRQDGSVYIDTGKINVSVPQSRVRHHWNPWRYWNPWQSQNRDRTSNRLSGNCHYSYQSTKQTTHLGNKTLQSSSYQHCN